MLPNEASRIRAEHARAILRKAHSVHDGVADDLKRCEGSLLTVQALVDRINEMLDGVKQGFQGGEDQGRSEGARDALVEVVGVLKTQHEQLSRETDILSGRLQQCRHTIDLLDAIADAEAAEANRVHTRPDGGPGHPGSSVAEQRRAESEGKSAP